MEVEVVQKSTCFIIASTLVPNYTRCIKLVSGRGDAGRDEKIDSSQSAIYPSNNSSPIPSHPISPNDPMASETVRLLPSLSLNSD